MKRFGEVPETRRIQGHRSASVLISRALLTRLCNQLEARIPDETRALRVSDCQAVVNEGIERDRALVDEARHLLR